MANAHFFPLVVVVRWSPTGLYVCVTGSINYSVHYTLNAEKLYTKCPTVYLEWKKYF